MCPTFKRSNTLEIKILKHCIKPAALFKEGNVILCVCVCISEPECER